MNPSLRLPALAALLALAGAAQAETGPYYIGTSASYTRESNLFRLTDAQKSTFEAQGGSASDTYLTLALVGGVDQSIGRQRLYGDLSLRRNRFGDNDDLNSTSYGTKLGLDWETVGNLSGKLELNADRNLRFDAVNENGQRITQENNESVRRFDATVRLGAQSRLRLEGGYTRRTVGYSLAAAQFRDYEEDSVFLGVRYRPANAFTFGADARRTEGTYPTRLAKLSTNPEDSLTRSQIDLLTVWAPGGASSVDGRLSFGKTSYEQFTDRDSSTPSWAVAWNWQPTGKLKLVTRLYRELGQNADVFSTVTTDDASKRTGLRLRADYELTGKILMDASVATVRRQLERTRTLNLPGIVVPGVTIEGADRFTEFALGARWLATRAVSVGCNFRTERRGTNSNPEINEKYSANTFSCFGQFVLQP